MKKFSKFPEIEQFRSAIHNIKHQAQYKGQDDDGNTIMDRNAKLPTIIAFGTEKLHGCFFKKTLITLANGEEIPISDIVKGMFILSYDIDKDEYVPKEVLDTFKFNSDKEWLELEFDDRKIICTEDHKFHTKNRGWVEAKDLNENDEFITT